MNNITFGDEKFGHYETVAGGAGAVSLSSIFRIKKKENLAKNILKIGTPKIITITVHKMHSLLLP